MSIRPATKAIFPVALITALLLPGAEALGYETDQYSDRFAQLEDSAEVLDQRVNDAIEAIAADWRRGDRRGRFATKIYRKLGGRHWVDKLERFAIRSPEIERIESVKRDTIYGGVPIWATRAVYVVGVGKTIQLNGTLVGTDKLGHFLSQGWKYNKRYLSGKNEESVVRLGVRNEKGIFGATTTGVFSNADLVANYEGYRFYRSLFEDDVIAGKPAIIRFEGDRAVVQRSFAWSDHVNEYWDEALNPNHFSRNLAKHIARNLEELCTDYARDPSAFVLHSHPDLESRYAHIGLRDTSSFRLDQVCEDDRVSTLGTR